MILKNYYNALKSLIEYSVQTNALINTSGVARDSGYNSTWGSVHAVVVSFRSSSISLSQGGSGWCFGKGDTAVAETDYCLSDMITSGLSGVVNMYARVPSITITNTSNASVTIKEVGYIAPCFTGQGTSASASCLLMRDVLSTPLTLAPNATGLITVQLDFTIPA